jgi:hypothetical protein
MNTNTKTASFTSASKVWDQFQPMPNGATLQLGTTHRPNRMGYSRIWITVKLTDFLVVFLEDADDIDLNADLVGALRDALVVVLDL